MPTIDVILPELHPKQAGIASDPARFRVLACGRRFGKTELAIDQMVNAVLDGQRVAYFTPTFRMGSEVWRKLRLVLADVIHDKNESERRLEAVTGGLIEFWSVDASESVRGRKYHQVIIDEAALIRSADTWEATLRPLLTDYKGRALFLSTPRGHNWFWGIYNRGNDPLFPDWKSWNYKTIDNPYMPPSEVEDARRTLPEMFYRQEYLADFIEDAGAVFRGVDVVSTLLSQPKPIHGHRYIFGVDWAKSYDYTVISVIDATTNEQVAVDRFNQISWALQRGRLKAMYDTWKPAVIYAEANSIGEPNIEALQSEGLPVHPFWTTPQTKSPLIEGLALAIERGDIALLNDPVQKEELKSYQMERLPSGIYRYGAPDGGHDDTVIALALALWGSVNGLQPLTMTTAPDALTRALLGDR